MSGDCEYANQHPVIEAEIENMKRRLDSLEGAEANRMKIRATDMKEFKDELKDTNTKVTALMLQMAGLNGKLAAAVFFSSGLGALGMFVIAKLFEAGSHP